MTRVMQRSDNQQPFGKENFLAGLPTLLGEKVRNQIRENYKGIIPYGKLTYGELIRFTQKEGLQIYQDLKLQKQLKKERYQCRKELGSFCHQFDIRNEPTASKPRYPKIQKRKETTKNKKKNKIDKTIKCYRCGKPGHISKYCKIKRKINNLNLDEEIEQKLNEILLETTSSENYTSTETDELQIDELHTTSQSSNDENEPSINMLTKDQEFMIEVIDKIQDLELKRECLLKLKSLLKDKPEKEKEIISSQSQMYNIQDIIFNKYEKIKPRQITNSELQLKIKQIKLELSQLKTEQQEMNEQMGTLKHETPEKSSSETEPEENTEEYMMILTEVSIQRYLIKINIVINNEFQLETIALFDTGADQNCIREGIIPTKYYNKTSESLKVAYGKKLKTTYKIPNAEISNKGTPFISLLKPYKVTNNSISTKVLNTKVEFPFVKKPKIRNLNLLKSLSIHNEKINNLINYKQKQISFLKEEICFKKLTEQLRKREIQKRIYQIKKEIESTICSDIPNAFWNRKKQEVSLPYGNDFDERQIPTKERPIQMIKEMEEFCRKEIQDLLNKILIRKSSSPWSCSAFYVIKKCRT
uniref:CCHC-type domain-containing protein n=1 Tax=Gossypium raimondii TaxID=29730 RepID=A0A0D2MWH4_GOSRA|nr:hypothetical protein B456_004G105400 [Gossypium raimondii]